jgi:hypothetical protein
MLVDEGPDPKIEDDEDDAPADVGGDDDEGQGGAAAEPDDVEPEGEDDESAVEDEPDPEPEPKPRKTREENFAAVRARERAATERAEKAEREAAELRARPRTQSQTEDPTAEAARLAAMTPEQRVDYKLAKAEETASRNAAVQQFQMADIADKTAFEAKATVDPRYKKYAPTVEAALLELRQKYGQNNTRENVLAFLIGRRVMENKTSKSAKEQRNAAAEGTKKQTTTPTKAKGDSGAGNSDSERAARRNRLEGVQI